MDYIIACPDALLLITYFEVGRVEDFAVHKALRIQLDMGRLGTTKRKYQKPASLASAFEDKIKDLINENDRKEEADIVTAQKI